MMKTNAEIGEAVGVLLSTADWEQFRDWDISSVCAVMSLLTVGVVTAVKETQGENTNETT